MLSCPCDNLFPFQLAPIASILLDCDECLGSFTPVRVIDCNNSDFKDLGVCGEEGFERYGRDVFAA